MAFKSLVIAVAVCICSNATAAIIVQGSDLDKQLFLDILDANSSGGTWTYGPGSSLQIVSPNDPSTFFQTLNEFAYRLYTNTFWTQDSHLEVGRNMPGVLLGAFDPSATTGAEVTSGTQLIDLADLLMVPVGAINTLTQAGVITHEVAEVTGSLLNVASYDLAHTNAIDAENFVYFDEGSTAYRLKQDITTVCSNQISQCTISIPWSNGVVELLVDGMDDIANIKSGIIKTGVPYDNSELDLQLLNVTTSPVPIPAAVWLFGSGLVVLIGFARRART